MRTRLLTLLAVASLSGCGTLTRQQRADHDLWKTQGRLIQEKREDAAFWLGLLPGGGSFYTRQYALGIIDLALWPISVLWDTAAGVGGAQRVNFEATWYALETGRLAKGPKNP